MHNKEADIQLDKSPQIPFWYSLENTACWQMLMRDSGALKEVVQKLC